MVEKMGKIVGKICILFCSIFTLFIEARIFMEVRTENGTNCVVAGQTFTIDVVIDEVYGSVSVPTIQGLDKFPSRQSGSYMSSINGKATARYSYQVRIDTIGSYILGPAKVMYQQQELVSNEVRIDVVKDVGTAQHNLPVKNNKISESKTFLRLMIDAESVVVGQKIGCTLRFYYQDPSISLLNLGSPELHGFDVKEGSKMEHGSADLEGTEYYYAQWRWDMYPTRPGEVLIPAYSADYEIPSKDNHLFAGLLMFVGNRAERKRVYSNAITIKVSPLPHCDLPVHSVGVFERFSAEIKPGMVKEGEGMVLAVEIEGNGNLQNIATPSLQLPAALKYYDSNNVIIPPKYDDELPKKRFEFIVQGMKSGDYEIPEQLFTYFDTENNEYVTLRTSPLAVSIMPGMMNKKDDNSSMLPFDREVVAFAEEETIIGINTVGQWYPVAERQSLPWWLFQLLFLLPCLYVGGPFILQRGSMLVGSNVWWSKKRALRHARKQIDQAAKDGNCRNLYTIFSELLQELERTHTLSLIKSSEWRDFFEQITHAAYAQADNINSSELCRVAKQWLERLEKNM